jgi:hypothetical protein
MVRGERAEASEARRARPGGLDGRAAPHADKEVAF